MIQRNDRDRFKFKFNSESMGVPPYIFILTPNHYPVGAGILGVFPQTCFSMRGSDLPMIENRVGRVEYGCGGAGWRN